jgi:hypothetical protein
MPLAATLEKPEDRHLPCSRSSLLAVAAAAEMTPIRLDLAIEKGCLLGQPRSDNLAQLWGKKDRSVAVQAGQLCRRTPRTSPQAASKVPAEYLDEGDFGACFHPFDKNIFSQLSTSFTEFYDVFIAES